MLSRGVGGPHSRGQDLMFTAIMSCLYLGRPCRSGRVADAGIIQRLG